MISTHPTAIAVIDFRRQGMLLEWHAMSGTWTACEEPPAIAHGIALIRADQPNICVYGMTGCLHLQVGGEHYALADDSLRLKFVRDPASLGLRRHFIVESAAGRTLLDHAYWSNQGDEFFRWLTAHASDAEWRSANGRLWSDGVASTVLRARGGAASARQ